MADLNFVQGFQNIFMLDTTPDADASRWDRIGAGISSFEPDGNEEIDQTGYLDGEGLASSEVTGGQLVVSFEGNRKVGDPAQDFIAGLALQYGAARKTTARQISPNGDTIEGQVTVANIVTGGGDANEKETFSFELHFNGRPTLTKGNASEFPSEITATAVPAKVGKTVECGAAADNGTALIYGTSDEAVATVDADGNVTGVKTGECELIVKSAVLPSLSKSVKITVTAS